MPSFANPFQGNVDKKMSKGELVQAIRLDIASELEAIFLYDAHVMSTTDPVAKKVLADIRDEEVAHIGELYALMKYLDPGVAELLASGQSEVKEMMEELGITEQVVNKTVGSLIDKE